MIGNKSFHGTLHNGADLYAGLRRCLFQYGSVIPGHGSDEMNRVMLVVVLFYIAVEKGFEGIEHQRMYFGTSRCATRKGDTLARNRLGKGFL